MSIINHAEVPHRVVTRSGIPTRTLVTSENGSTACTLWEQFLPPGGVIPLHTHPTEEIITVLSGTLTATVDGVSSEVAASMTVFIRAQLLHGFRNHGTEVAHTLVFFPTNAPQVIYPDE
jgi:quercetin dioxygenase-like cupin family protein